MAESRVQLINHIDISRLDEPWALTNESVLSISSVDVKKGLSKEEVLDRRNTLGNNKLKEKAPKPFWKHFLKELREPMQILLLVVGVVYSIWGHWWDAIFIFCIIFLMIFVEVQNEARAKKALLKLSQAVPKFSSVIRDGQIQSIPNEDLVIGDVILLKAGQFVAADTRLISSLNLEVDEAILTGESVPVQKDASIVLEKETILSERRNVAFAGTYVTRGKATGVVVSVISTNQSELGRIFELLAKSQQTKGKTPLQKMLKTLAKYLTITSLIIAVSIPLLGIARQQYNYKELILVGLALAFATIPEELPILIKAVLAVGSLRLSKKNLLIKDLHAAELLGTVTTILTDKTGTLTQNILQLSFILSGQAGYEMQEVNRMDSLPSDLQFVLETWILNSEPKDMEFIDHDKNNTIVDPFDQAIVTALKETNLWDSCQQLILELGALETLKEIPFDPKTKASCRTRMLNSQETMFIKGAPEVLLFHSKFIVKNGSIVPLDAQTRDEITTSLEGLATSGLRVIGFGRKIYDPNDSEELLSNVIFVGTLGFEDRIREEAYAAVQACKSAGIQIKMVTGDHALTAISVAQKVGLTENPNWLEGEDIDRLSDDDLRSALSADVISRATPTHKYKLVEFLQKQGEIVAVTGDGFNDAPALKLANVGVAMGKIGTDLAKDAASMVILDDKFSTLQLGILESRKLFDNLIKSIRFYLACKFALVLLFFSSVIFGFRFPLSPIQIIVLEMFMDLGASSTFVIEPAESNVMERPPRNPKEKFLNFTFLTWVVLSGLSLFSLVLISYFLDYTKAEESQLQSMAFTAWMFGHFFLAMQLRTLHQPLLTHGIFSNGPMILWILAVVLVLVCVLYIPPLATAMKLRPLAFHDFFMNVFIALFCTMWIDIFKMLYSCWNHRKNSHSRLSTQV